MSEVKSISVKELYALHEKGEKPFVVDCRTLPEVEEVRAGIVSQVMPLQEWDPESLKAGKDDKVYIICRSGQRSFQAASQCVVEGFTEVFNVEGGTMDWVNSGLPVSQGDPEES